MVNAVSTGLAAAVLAAVPAGAAPAKVAAALAVRPVPAAGAAQPDPDAMLPTGGQVFRDALSRWSAAASPATASGDLLEMPVAASRLSSSFGVRHDPLGKGMRLHLGIDIPDASGAPVHAAAGGTIVFAGRSPGYGNLVQIDHGGGEETRYGHLRDIAVSVGERVSQGVTIGSVGSTGRSTGPHLHFEVRRDGLAMDPLAALGTVVSNPSDTATPAPPPQQRWAGFEQGDGGLPQSRLR